MFRKKTTPTPSLLYGRVEIIEGPFKGSIGDYDNDEYDGAVVYLDDDRGVYHVFPYGHLQSLPESPSVLETSCS